MAFLEDTVIVLVSQVSSISLKYLKFLYCFDLVSIPDFLFLWRSRVFREAALQEL